MENNKEIWKDVVGFERVYKISNLGRIKSLTRVVPHSYSKTITVYEKYLKLHFKHNGYITVILAYAGAKSRYYVHRLLATHFIPNPRNYPQINHIDGNPKNNSLNNLEWSTQKQNVDHAIKIGLKKLTPVYQFKNGVLIASFRCMEEAYKITNIPSSNICNCIAGRRKAAGGFVWKK